jgi:hypothetical protein
VLVTVRVLGEGVDLPWLRRLVDARPTLSPVMWLQQLGRITRPKECECVPGSRPCAATTGGGSGSGSGAGSGSGTGAGTGSGSGSGSGAGAGAGAGAGGSCGCGATPIYIATNRNYERHAYLLGGVVPRASVAAAQKAFERPSTRTAARALGLERLRRFKAIPLPLVGGVTGHMYSLFIPGARETRELCALVDPQDAVPLLAERVNRFAGEGGCTCGTKDPRKHADGCPQERVYGKWVRCAPTEELEGYQTSRVGPASERQNDWWKRSASGYGLDPDAEVTARQIPALAVLRDLGLRMGGGTR